MAARSWQSRLSSKLENILNKLYSNHIKNAGHVFDFIRIKIDLTRQKDISNYIVQYISVVNGIVVNNVNVQTHIVNRSGIGYPAVNTYDVQPFTVYLPADVVMEQGDLLLWYIDVPNTESGSDSIRNILQVKDIHNVFGNRVLLYKKCMCTYYDEKLPLEILNYCDKLFMRRKKIKY